MNALDKFAAAEPTDYVSEAEAKADHDRIVALIQTLKTTRIQWDA